MIQGKSPTKEISSQVPENQGLSQPQTIPLTTQLFLFRQLVIDILNHCKKNIKGQPFDDMHADKLVETNLSRSIDIYQQYFLIGIGTSKTRQFVCNRYQRLIRENLVNKDSLPPQMITAIINARAAAGPNNGGSTASSGSNSIVGSATNIHSEKSIQVGRLLSTILCHTIQPSSEIGAALNFILEGSRNKLNGNNFVHLMEELYNNLNKYKKRPIDRFLSHFIDSAISQVEYHQAPYIQYQKKYQVQLKKLKRVINQKNMSNYRRMPSIMKQENEQSIRIPDPPPSHEYIKMLQPHQYLSKQRMCLHAEDEEAKFGKCFICGRGANNYDKSIFVPLCSMDCKNKLKRINQQCIMNDHFSFINWIIQTLFSVNWNPGTGDQILYNLLLREINETDTLGIDQITSIIQIIVNNFSLQAIGISSSSQTLQSMSSLITNRIIQCSALVISSFVRKYPQLMFRQQERQFEQKERNRKSDLDINFFTTKVITLQIIRLLQVLPIMSNSLQLTLLKSLCDILSARSPSDPTIGLKQFYINCDCKILESNIVERIFNLISQYALFSNSSSNQRNSTGSTASTTALGTNTSLGTDTSNAISLGVINNVSINGNNCSEAAISGLEDILSSIVRFMHYFELKQENFGEIDDILKEKKVKKYLQSKFIQQFNKKPMKAVDSVRKLFQDQITPKDFAILIRQNMDYETKVKKVNEKIVKQQVGTFFGTAKKDKNGNVEDYNQKIYWEFLKLLDHQFAGKEIDDCLRITFNSFMMPKQGQQVQVVLGPLSLALQPHLGLKVGEQATATYQLIMVSLMVQTSNNPNVKQNEKLKYDGFKNFCSEIDKELTQARMLEIYNRIKKRPLEYYIEYRGHQVFTKKYLSSKSLRTSFWKYIQNIDLILETQNPGKIKNQQKPEEGNLQKIESSESKKSIENEEQEKNIRRQNLLSFLFQNLWQYVYMSTVNRFNLRCLQQACVIYGKAQLFTEFQAFFNHLYKIHSQLSEKSSNTLQGIGKQAKLIILKLAIQFSNCVIGRQSWLIILKIIYKLDREEVQKAKTQSPKKNDSIYASYQYQASDKLFTRTNTFDPERLKQFLEAMCEFSSSQVKTDKTYTRQMYILHHIAQIIEYNLQRFEENEKNQEQDSIWATLWPTIRSYYRNICLHPRKQICMSAIDSYKQLTMKMLKLNSKVNNINHTELLNVYLEIFERSSAFIKDLIINVLLNVVCKEMKSGWNEVYTILEIADSQDKNIVMKVVSRIISEIGLANVGNLIRLHQIILKELRIAPQQNFQLILNQLWEICEHFNRLNIWLETLSKIKDIYKATTNLSILSFTYKICNNCLEMIYAFRKQEQKLVENSGEQIQDQIEQQYIQQAYQQNVDIKEIQPKQALKFIYFEVFSTQMHILQIRNPKIFLQNLFIFKQLSIEIFLNNLGTDFDNKTGFLSLWEMFITSVYSVHFCYFLHDYLSYIFNQLSFVYSQLISGEEVRIVSCRGQLLEKKKFIAEWLIKTFEGNCKDQLLDLCKQDQDLNKGFKDTLENQSTLSGKTQLIQFYLSSKQYQQTSTQYLIFLQILKIYYENELKYESRNQQLDEKILSILLESYRVASEINSRPLLRNFLWNNQFFKGQQYLPGLMKQELRSLQIIVRYFDLSSAKGRIYQIALSFLSKFVVNSNLYWSRKTIKDSENVKKNEKKTKDGRVIETISAQGQPSQIGKLIDALYQDLGLWITNSENLLVQILKKFSIQIKQRYEKSDEMFRHQSLSYQQLFNICIQISKRTGSHPILIECSRVLQELVEKMY